MASFTYLGNIFDKFWSFQNPNNVCYIYFFGIHILFIPGFALPLLDQVIK